MVVGRSSCIPPRPATSIKSKLKQLTFNEFHGLQWALHRKSSLSRQVFRWFRNMINYTFGSEELCWIERLTSCGNPFRMPSTIEWMASTEQWQKAVQCKTFPSHQRFLCEQHKCRPSGCLGEYSLNIIHHIAYSRPTLSQSKVQTLNITRLLPRLLNGKYLFRAPFFTFNFWASLWNSNFGLLLREFLVRLFTSKLVVLQEWAYHRQASFSKKRSKQCLLNMLGANDSQSYT